MIGFPEDDGWADEGWVRALDAGRPHESGGGGSRRGARADRDGRGSGGGGATSSGGSAGAAKAAGAADGGKAAPASPGNAGPGTGPGTGPANASTNGRTNGRTNGPSTGPAPDRNPSREAPTTASRAKRGGTDPRDQASDDFTGHPEDRPWTPIPRQAKSVERGLIPTQRRLKKTSRSA
ncbi:hypothetical protein GCM10009839_21160 [Catenulispora yoronensis]|uniref:Uncharacterized protein n=1 Tax=Catenulispora yoronensis TaxID=450799 RepID=A0ABN2TWH3_9ACTN